MFKSIDIHTAAGHLKNIVDSIRCGVCDKSGGTRLRYACGHTSCQDCAVFSDECSLCLTPPQSSSKPVLDYPLTQRSANALNLLNVFENEFHIDVYKQQRISEQLKVEKEVFPECIQAPVKYTNKRKSTKHSTVHKENRLSQLPGEEISLISSPKMEKNEHVEMWLNKYVRKPFADLNSNDRRLSQDAKMLRIKQNIETENTPKKQTRKRSYFKSALSSVKIQTLIVDHLSPVMKTQNTHKKARIDLSPLKQNTSINNTDIRITDNDESGIAMDEDDAVIVIDDSQSIIVDKDYNAWLAVQEAERNKVLSSSGNNTRSIQETPPKDKPVHTDIKVAKKVPFYLKSSLCQSNEVNSSKEINHKEIVQSIKPTSNKVEQANDASITISNKSFIAIITIKQDKPGRKPNSVESVEVQTDISETKFLSMENIEEKEKDECVTKSLDVFKDHEKLAKEPEENCLKSLNRTDNVVIVESDSDDDIGLSKSLEVTAEIHRSCEEVDYGILTDIGDLEQHCKRARRIQRGFTPTSTDSSEKENFNPNRVKKTNTSKKKPNKK